VLKDGYRSPVPAPPSDRRWSVEAASERVVFGVALGAGEGRPAPDAMTSEDAVGARGEIIIGYGGIRRCGGLGSSWPAGPPYRKEANTGVVQAGRVRVGVRRGTGRCETSRRSS